MNFDDLDRDWLKKQMQEYQLTVEQLVAEMGSELAGNTLRHFINGGVEWAVIPRPLKKEIIAGLESIFGPLSQAGEATSPHTVKRRTSAAATGVLSDEQIRDLFGNSEYDETLYSRDPSLSGAVEPQPRLLEPPPKDLGGWELCIRCRTQIWGVDAERCTNPNCKRPLLNYN